MKRMRMQYYKTIFVNQLQVCVTLESALALEKEKRNERRFQRGNTMSKEWNEEFELLRAMQENRMHLSAAKQCVDRCTKHTELLTNLLLPHEKACLEDCFQKRAQVQFIVAANVAKFEEIDSRATVKKGWI